jgi:hypothetical protein
VRLAAPANPAYDDLLSSTWRVIALDMAFECRRVTNNVRRLSWSSVNAKAHTVTWLPALGGAWTTLWTTNGHGGTQTFTHTNAAGAGFYRVRYQP